MDDKVLELLRDMKKEQTKRFNDLDGRLDGLDGRLDGLDGRLDGLEGRLDRLENKFDGLETELKDFRRETSQNFAIIVDENRKVRNEVSDLKEKQQSDYSHLDLKTDALQSDLLKLKRQ